MRLGGRRDRYYYPCQPNVSGNNAVATLFPRLLPEPPRTGLQRCHGIATIEYIERHAVNTEERTHKSLGVDDCGLQTLIYGVV